MITVRKEWQCKMGDMANMINLLQEYKESFDPSPACRIYKNVSGYMHHFVIEDDYESMGDYEVKWNERVSTPEFQQWLTKWNDLTVDGTFTFTFLRNLAE